jgi:hypothetical protein
MEYLELLHQYRKWLRTVGFDHRMILEIDKAMRSPFFQLLPECTLGLFETTSENTLKYNELRLRWLTFTFLENRKGYEILFIYEYKNQFFDIQDFIRYFNENKFVP